MKRLVHFAGDAQLPVPLPHNCQWVRVTDYDALGLIFGALAVGPDAIGTYEQPAIVLDSRDPIAVVGFQCFESRIGFKSLLLQGNIEVEFGEGEPSPGALFRRPRVESPFQVSLPAGDATSHLFALPKGTQSLHLAIVDGVGANITRLRLFPLFSSIAGAATKGGSANTPWYPGAAWTPNLSHALSGGQAQSTPILDTGVLGGLQVLTAIFAPGGIVANDVANGFWARPWAPPTGFGVLVNCADAVQLRGFARGGD